MCVVAEVGIALACESGRRAHAFPSHAQQCAKQLLLYTSTRRGSSTERRLHGIQLEQTSSFRYNLQHLDQCSMADDPAKTE